MAINMRTILRNVLQLQQILEHDDCTNRRHYHDLYLTNMRVMRQYGTESDYWPAALWYDQYFCRQVKLSAEFLYHPGNP